MVWRNNLLILKCVALAVVLILSFQIVTLAERFNLFRRLALTSLVHQIAGKYATPGSEQIYFYGDSLTAGGGASFLHDFPTLISFLYGRKCINMGFPSETSTQIKERFLKRVKNGQPEFIVFWVGRNNIDKPEEVKHDVADMIADLSPNSRFLVLGVTNADTERERIGGSNYSDAANINDYLKVKYGNVFIDILGALRERASTSQADQASLDAGIIPASERFDKVHLNDRGQVVVAVRVEQELELQGW